MTRVAVFIDYSNAYYTARDVFGIPAGDRGLFGQFHPQRLGQFLSARLLDQDPARHLLKVSMFLGQPTFKSGPRRQSAAASQIATWKSEPLVAAHTRPLRYVATAWENGRATAWRSDEKGIDVLMALAVALDARDDLYDVGIVVTGDTDLLPAIDVALAAGKTIETAMWWSEQDPNRKLPHKTSIHHHQLDHEVYDFVADLTDYGQPRRHR